MSLEGAKTGEQSKEQEESRSGRKGEDLEMKDEDAERKDELGPEAKAPHSAGVERDRDCVGRTPHCSDE